MTLEHIEQQQWRPLASMVPVARQIRAQARLISALILFAFVICHLASHAFLIVSIPMAGTVLAILMAPWWTLPGSALLATALAVHFLNALWSIYIRRYLRMRPWEWAQLLLGLAIPPLIMMHVIGTRISDIFLGTVNDYVSVLVRHWVISPQPAALQIAGVLVIWIHACIGLHFWLRTKYRYRAWLPALAGAAVAFPTLALAGYVAGGSTVLREARESGFTDAVLVASHSTPEKTAQGRRITAAGLAGYLALVLLPFAGRLARNTTYRMRQPPKLTHAGGRTVVLLPGATVLETLRANGIPHASVCGGRGRCTTCRIQVISGLDALSQPAGLEAAALARIGAASGTRLACQIRPTTNITVLPLLSADAGATDGLVRGGMEGSEREVTVVFIDLRGSTEFSETRLPYDVLFILNQFFYEMNRALVDTGGHYSNFTGDGLMAIYGLDGDNPAVGATQALRGAAEMVRRLDQLNAQLKIDLNEPLRIGIGIHCGEAIVGAMGPPRSQIVTAIGATVNTTARLEGLTKENNCVLVLSARAARLAGLELAEETLRSAPLRGRSEKVEFYALRTIPQPPA
jgi:adenylate cyclase